MKPKNIKGNNIQLLDIQSNVENTNNTSSKYEGVEITPIEGTPFSIVSDNDKMWGGVGEYRITETFKKNKKGKEELEEDLKKIKWDRITQIVYLMMEKYEEFKKLNIEK